MKLFLSSGGAEEERWRECPSLGAQKASELWKGLKRSYQAAKIRTKGEKHTMGHVEVAVAAAPRLSLKRPKIGLLVWRMRAVRDTWRNSSKEKRASEKCSLKEAAGAEMHSLTSLTMGSQVLNGGFDNKRAEGDTPGKIQLPETGGEQKPAGHWRSRWGNRSASGKISQRFLQLWFL